MEDEARGDAPHGLILKASGEGDRNTGRGAVRLGKKNVLL